MIHCFAILSTHVVYNLTLLGVRVSVSSSMDWKLHDVDERSHLMNRMPRTDVRLQEIREMRRNV